MNIMCLIESVISKMANLELLPWFRNVCRKSIGSLSFNGNPASKPWKYTDRYDLNYKKWRA